MDGLEYKHPVEWLDDDPFAGPTVTDGPITYHFDLVQGSDEWLAARCGILTASEMKLIITPTLKTANNDKSRSHLYELLAQRITRFVEPTYISDDMLRGMEDEPDAVGIYSREVAPVRACGFITNDRHGFRLGYSPDGLVGVDGLVECKSRKQKFQVQTIIEHVATGNATVPADYILQLQTGLLVSEREWIDFLSFCGGMPMIAIRVCPDDEMQAAILEAAADFEAALIAAERKYFDALDAEGTRAFPTERKDREEISL